MPDPLEILATEVRSCTKCVLSNTRKKSVPGEGPHNAEIFLLGMCPGNSENACGRPFIGESGQLLTRMLTESGIHREDCFISNTVKCLPLNKSGALADPEPKHIRACQDYLIRELNLVRPKIVIALGAVALQWLEESRKKPIMGERIGQVFALSGLRGEKLSPYGEIVIAVNFHPSFILRDNRNYDQAVGVFKKVLDYLGGKMARTGDLFLHNPDPVFVVRTREDLEKFHQDWLDTFDPKTNALAFDVETTDLNFKKAILLGVSVSWGDLHSYYLPLKQTGPELFPANDPKFLPRTLPDYWSSQEGFAARIILADMLGSSCRKVAHNASFDRNMLRENGFRVGGIVEDTMDLYHNAVNPACGLISLNEIASRYPNLSGWKRAISSCLGREPNRPFDFARCPLDVLGPYGARDSLATHKLWRDLQPEVDKNKVRRTFDEFTTPAHAGLTEIEYNGILVDVERCDQLIEKFSVEANQLEERAYELAEKRFLLTSHQQVGKVLFGDLGLTPYKETETGRPSTDKISLTVLATQHELPKTLLRHRKLLKILSTYLEPIRNLSLESVDGRVRARFNLTGTVTGRCSSSNPLNFQNLPKREFPEVREIFISEPGYTLLEADQSQIEIRLTAWFCEDRGFLDLIRSGLDFHTATASKMFGIKSEDVTEEQRYLSKTCNFSLLYGSSPKKLVETAAISGKHMTERFAKKLIDQYYTTFPGLNQWKRELIRNTLPTMRVRNAFMRFRDFDRHKVNEDRGAFEREAANFPVQSTAADILYRNGIVLLSSAIDLHQLDARYVCTVHDSVMLETRDNHVNRLAKLMYEIMPLPVPPVDIPLAVDVKAGQNWGQMEKLKMEDLV